MENLGLKIPPSFLLSFYLYLFIYVLRSVCSSVETAN